MKHMYVSRSCCGFDTTNMCYISVIKEVVETGNDRYTIQIYIKKNTQVDGTDTDCSTFFFLLQSYLYCVSFAFKFAAVPERCVSLT